MRFGFFIILGAERCDIGSTAGRYAIEAFKRYGADFAALDFERRRAGAMTRWPQ